MEEIKNGKFYQGTVEKLALGGKGVVHMDGFVVFVKNALPGQEIEFQVTRKKKNYAEAKVQRVLKVSPLEIESPYEKMPGCALQNIPYALQLEIKQQQVIETLEHIGGIDVQRQDIEFLDIVPSPQEERYRNKVEFSFGYAKMWVEEGPNEERIYHDEHPSLGFHPEGNWSLVQSISDSLLCTPHMNTIRQIVENTMKQSAFPVWNSKICKGFWRGLLLRESQATGHILVNIIVSEFQEHTFWEPLIAELTKKIPEISGILQTENTNRNDAIHEDLPYEILYGSDRILEKLEEVEYEIGPFTFFQTNTLGAEKLFSVIRDFANLSGKEKVLDLFCGSGAIGLFLAENAGEIVGLELQASAVENAKKNAERNSVENVEYWCGKAEKLLPEVLEHHPEFDVVVVDPPRAGIHPKALEILLQITARKLIFVSCNPATLARDLAELTKEKWQIRQVCPVDMFPHTPHIEGVVLLEQKN